MNVAIVVAAGKGTRLGGDRPKQFLELGSIPIIIHTLRQFERSQEIDEMIAVLPAEESEGFLSVAHRFGLRKLSRAVTGGATRSQSVLRGLSLIETAEVVAVHDGVRPFVSIDEIDRTIRLAREQGAAVLLTPIADTIKEVQHGQVIRTVPRTDLRRALTPQSFRFEILKRAYEDLADIEATGMEITDDCFLVERLGIEIFAVEGSSRNIKITNQEDLVLAEAIMRSLEPGK